ncbi:MLO-like protein 5 [Linum grandiflorum]
MNDQIRGWKEWEVEGAKQHEQLNDPTRFRLTHETSFVKSHTSFWTKTPVSFYIVCFFRQFFRSVSKADYLTMRHGFISVHLAPGSKFDFQKYIKRSLEDDFKVVVGISPLLWASVVFFMLLNVHGWHVMFPLSLLPLFVILAVGTKLQSIITEMAIEITERHAVVQGIPLVQVTDRHFWFSWPQLILYLIHFVLFQNAFELTYSFWIWYEFGMDSCFHEHHLIPLLRMAVGVGAQFLCSYITLPLYALVTQVSTRPLQTEAFRKIVVCTNNWLYEYITWCCRWVRP